MNYRIRSYDPDVADFTLSALNVEIAASVACSRMYGPPPDAQFVDPLVAYTVHRRDGQFREAGHFQPVNANMEPVGRLFHVSPEAAG